MNGPTTSKTLLQRVREGNSAAWCEFVTRYAEFIRQRLRRRIPPAELDDAHARVRSELERIVGNWDPERGFRVYLLGAIRNVEYRVLRELYGQGPESGSIGSGVLQVPSPDEPDPDAEISKEEIGTIAGQVLDWLRDRAHREGKEEQYDCFVAVVFDAQTSEEVARRHGVPPSTARSWTYRWRQYAREHLEDFFRDYFGVNWEREYAAWAEVLLGKPRA